LSASNSIDSTVMQWPCALPVVCSVAFIRFS
jgi:hypothetical protein